MEKYLNFWTAALLFFAAVFALAWLGVGAPSGFPKTAKNCIELVKRIDRELKTGERLTPAEELDLEECGKP